VLVPEPSFRRKRVKGIPGSPPNLLNPPSGCRFHPRCGLAMDVCKTEDPPQVGDDLKYSMCFWAEQHPGEPVSADEVVPAEEPTYLDDQEVAADRDLDDQRAETGAVR
jgi:peptide/nickel transport system ATP-binding protein